MMGGINVKRHKMVMIVACLLIVGLLPFLYFFSYTQTNQVSEREQVLVMTEKQQDLKGQTEKNDSAEEERYSNQKMRKLFLNSRSRDTTINR